jgi:hypothetical protein
MCEHWILVSEPPRTKWKSLKPEEQIGAESVSVEAVGAYFCLFSVKSTVCQQAFMEVAAIDLTSTPQQRNITSGAFC